MPTYLAISHNNESKRYLATSAYPTKPYMHVGNDVIPLTTNTTSGLQLKVKIGGQTYRPMEYGSESASASYYTTAEVSEGLSETTALTRVSTSGESYLTRESTSGTSYLTSVDCYRFRYTMTDGSHTSAQTYYDRTFIYDVPDVTSWSVDTASIRCQYMISVGNSYSYDTWGVATLYRKTNGANPQYSYYETISGYTFNPYVPRYSDTTFSGDPLATVVVVPLPVKVTATNPGFIIDRNTGENFMRNGGIYVQPHKVLTDHSNWQVYGGATASQSVLKKTTGTSYLTCESTSETIYLTRESTYGYSGISSSSSESSGWK